MFVSLRCCRPDYVSWIKCLKPPVGEKLFDLVLICRLLNNSSRFCISSRSDWNGVKELAGKSLTPLLWTTLGFLPQNALKNRASAAKSLIASNSRVKLPFGTTFRQLSLTEYFHGLQLLSEQSPCSTPGSEAVFFPVREFDDASLVLPGGRSALVKLCMASHAVIIEDVDLDAQRLRWHLESRN